MIVWVARMIAVAALVAAACWAADRGLGSLGRPRRFVWAAGLLLVVVLPVLALAAPGWLPDAGTSAAFAVAGTFLGSLIGFGASSLKTAYGLGPGALQAGGTGAAAGAPHGLLALASDLVVPAWLLASITLALVLLAGRARLLRASSRWRGTEVDGVPVRLSEAVGPAVVGLLRPRIVLPAWANALPKAERALIIRHELEHVRAGDSRLLAAAAAPLVLLPWCLPLWWMHRRLRDAVETDCDARVLARGADVRTYGSALLRTAGRGSALPFPVPALSRAPSLLERRILAMTRKKPKHPIITAATLLAVAGAGVVAACGALTSTDALEPEVEANAVTSTDEATHTVVEQPAEPAPAEERERRLTAEEGVVHAIAEIPIAEVERKRVAESALMEARRLAGLDLDVPPVIEVPVTAGADSEPPKTLRERAVRAEREREVVSRRRAIERILREKAQDRSQI